MMRCVLLTCLLSWGIINANDEEAARRIFSHLKIHDPQSAVELGQSLIKQYPQSEKVRLAFVQALAEKGDEVAVFKEWNEMRQIFEKDRFALEVLAWSVLKKAEISPQIHIHLSSLIGAALTRDVRSIPMIVSSLRHSSAVVRLLGVRFAATLGDAVLQEELSRLLEEEEVWFVRQEVIKAVGMLRIISLKPHLIKIVSSSYSLAEEKVEAILALVQMYDGVRKNDLTQLITSRRAGLRQLACELIAYYDLHGYKESLEKLALDRSPDVRMQALQSLCLMKAEIKPELLQTLLEDSHPQVAITAAWAACRVKHPKGAESLKKWIHDIHPKWRSMAAAMATTSGSLGLEIAKELLTTHDDPFVRANLALGLIGQRVEVSAASEVVNHFFNDAEIGKIMWDTTGSVRMIAPSAAFHIEQIQNYPKMVDQLTRLDLLNLLCILSYKDAQQSAKQFLKRQTWSVTGPAVALLLREGDEEALSLIRELLNENDAQIRVQAALMLALYGNDSQVLKVLQKAYPQVNRETKIQILEAIGHVGSKESLPFLIDVVAEPFQLLRVIAASAIIQCLYH